MERPVAVLPESQSHGPHRTLHAAAMPFPSYQGTQAAIRSMLEVLTAHHREPHLLVYAQSGYDFQPGFALHRLSPRPPQSSLRSGPSLAKCVLDLRFAQALRRLQRNLQPQVVVAHHVEAGAAALFAGSRPFVFFAHTDLAAELPTYANCSPPLRKPAEILCSSAGHWVDMCVSRCADAVAVISPQLEERFAALHNGPPSCRRASRRTSRWTRWATAAPQVAYVPTPWPIFEPLHPDERQRARRYWEFGPEEKVVAYAGNLDNYQHWEAVLRAVQLASSNTPSLRLLFATASDPRPLWSEARKIGIADRMRVVGLAGEEAAATEHAGLCRPTENAEDGKVEQTRRAVHAAADLMVVPRRVPGGLPVKMLDALARGVPVVAAKQATAGLALDRVAWVTEVSAANALASGIAAVCSSSRLRSELRKSGPEYVATQHSPERFLQCMDRVCESARRRVPPPE